MSPQRKDDRVLTDADLEALSDKVIEKFEKKFYLKLGEGIWGMAWKLIVVAIAALAGYKLGGR